VISRVPLLERRFFLGLLQQLGLAFVEAGLVVTHELGFRFPRGLLFAKLLLGGLAKLGYTPGQNLAFEGPRGAAGQSVQLPHLMEELKAAKVDVIVRIYDSGLTGLSR
jgi:hypothetical protein